MRSLISRALSPISVFAGFIIIFLTVSASDAEAVRPLGLMLGLLAGIAAVMAGIGCRQIISVVAAVAFAIYTKSLNIGRRIRVREPYRRKTLRHAGGFEISRSAESIENTACKVYDLRCYSKCS